MNIHFWAKCSQKILVPTPMIRSNENLSTSSLKSHGCTAQAMPGYFYHTFWEINCPTICTITMRWKISSKLLISNLRHHKWRIVQTVHYLRINFVKHGRAIPNKHYPFFFTQLNVLRFPLGQKF